MNIVLAIMILMVVITPLTLTAAMLGLGIVSKYSDNPWYCHTMDWHKSPAKRGFDGCSCTGVCPRCNKPILMDGNGDWFSVGHP